MQAHLQSRIRGDAGVAKEVKDEFSENAGLFTNMKTNQTHSGLKTGNVFISHTTTPKQGVTVKNLSGLNTYLQNPRFMPSPKPHLDITTSATKVNKDTGKLIKTNTIFLSVDEGQDANKVLRDQFQTEFNPASDALKNKHFPDEISHVMGLNKSFSDTRYKSKQMYENQSLYSKTDLTPENQEFFNSIAAIQESYHTMRRDSGTCLTDSQIKELEKLIRGTIEEHMESQPHLYNALIEEGGYRSESQSAFGNQSMSIKEREQLLTKLSNPLLTDPEFVEAH